MPKPVVFIGGTEVETVDFPTQNFDAVHALGDVVRLHEYVGSKAAQKLIYRVSALPDPRARRKAEREGYGFTPITGGPQTRVNEGWMLVPASAADKALADRTVPAETFYPGMVVTCARLTGATADERLVVLDVARDGSVQITKLGGMEGRSWSKIPAASLRHATL